MADTNLCMHQTHDRSTQQQQEASTCISTSCMRTERSVQRVRRRRRCRLTRAGMQTWYGASKLLVIRRRECNVICLGRAE